MSTDLLYIHPSGHLDDLVVPAGALACVNAAPVSKLGRFAYEVGDDEIAQARVIAIDLHWAVAMPGFEALVAHVRRVAPRVPVVVGGITAGFYARELLERFAVDYVVRGHSEQPFRELVGALVDGGNPAGIPGVCVREAPEPSAHAATRAELDAIDCLTADWFPTYERCSGWEAAAFPPGRTIPAARGCPQRCPECYGSFASIFDESCIVRSPEAVARDLARAAEAGMRNLRFFVGKPSPKQLHALVVSLAAQGPVRLPSAVGFYLCRAPAVEDLERLDASFDNDVSISMVPPAEHWPRLGRARLDDELRAWRRAAAYVASSRHLELDAWSTRSGGLDLVRRELIEQPAPRVKVSSAASWRVTRPTDGGGESYDQVRDAVAGVWSFYAARALSPALAALLAPFAFLDEITEDPERAPIPEPAFRALHRAMLRAWREHALPVWPELRWSLVPCALRGGGAPSRELFGIRTSGLLRVVPAGAVDRFRPEQRLDLRMSQGHRGVELSTPASADALAARAGHAIAFAPLPLPPEPMTASWLDALGAHGFVVLDPSRIARNPPDAGGTGETVEVRARVHLQGVSVTLVARGERMLGEGRADLGYFRA